MALSLLNKTVTPDVTGLPLCDICANGCDCGQGQPACEHFACWGTGTDADTTCPGAERERVLLAAWTASRTALPRG